MTPDEMRDARVQPDLTGPWNRTAVSAGDTWAIGAEICERLDAILAAVRTPGMIARVEDRRDAQFLGEKLDAILAELRKPADVRLVTASKEFDAVPSETLRERGFGVAPQTHEQPQKFQFAFAEDAKLDIAITATAAWRERAEKAEARVRELEGKAIQYDLDRAGIESRAAEATELVELRARVRELDSVYAEATRDRDAALALAERRGEFARRWRKLFVKYASEPGWYEPYNRLAAEEDGEK